MEKNERTMREGFEHLMEDEHQKIVFGALKKLNVRPFTMKFDDLLQEGRIAYAKAYVRYPEDPRENDLKFHVYAYQAVYWRVIDLLQHDVQMWNRQTTELVEEDEHGMVQAPSPKLLDRLIMDDIFCHLYEIATPAERRFLSDCYVEGLTNGEIACKEGISRQAIYRLKKKVGLKFLMILGQERD